jgi:hypothetical protein
LGLDKMGVALWWEWRPRRAGGYADLLPHLKTWAEEQVGLRALGLQGSAMWPGEADALVSRFPIFSHV